VNSFKAKLLAAAAALAFLASPALADNPGYTLPNGTAVNGHLITEQGTPPSGTNCTISAGSTDLAGKCTATSGAPTVTFGTAYTTAPFCTVQDSSATPAVVYTVSTTAITITGTNAHVYFWSCFVPNGG
jgi:hypothetical protein